MFKKFNRKVKQMFSQNIKLATGVTGMYIYPFYNYAHILI